MKIRQKHKEKNLSDITRRAFLRGIGGSAGLTILVSGRERDNPANIANRNVPPNDTRNSRAEQAYQIRLQAADRQKSAPFPKQQGNNDENLYPNKIATYTKGLVHNSRGEVDPKSYQAFKTALDSGSFQSFESIPMGNSKKLVNPLAAYTFALEGRDSHQFALAPAPKFNSSETASEMTELYWMALCRDISFDEYDQNELIRRAITELSDASGFKDMAEPLTSRTVFRGLSPENKRSPYISQFLWNNVPLGSNTFDQKINVPVAELDYMHTFDRWLDLQRGAIPRLNPLGTMTGYELDRTPRYIRNGRDLGEFVHRDQIYVPFLHACLSLAGMGAADDLGNPYRRSRTQTGFCTFGEPHILDLLARVANAGLKAAWFQKWPIHLRLRPEAFSGRIHLIRNGKADYPVSQKILNSPVLDLIYKHSGSYLLPQAYPEAAPLHPAYPSAHSVIAGACATVLKAYFDEATYIRNPVIASRDGLTLKAYKGEALTIGGEINKLADNIGMGRIMAGIHWRSDHLSGLLLGENVAIELMRDTRDCFTESKGVFSLTKFDGKVILI